MTADTEPAWTVDENGTYYPGVLSRDGWDPDAALRELWGDEIPAIVEYGFDDDPGYMRRLEEKRQRHTVVPCVTCGTPTPKAREANRYTTCGPDCRRIFLGLYNHFAHKEAPRTYIIPGTMTDAVALEAYRRNLPIFQLLPEAIRDQIAGRTPRIRYLRRSERGRATGR
jgi:endogenous inhibitor of DNA gyrase (YacG/DUF329 family)